MRRPRVSVLTPSGKLRVRALCTRAARLAIASTSALVVLRENRPHRRVLTVCGFPKNCQSSWLYLRDIFRTDSEAVVSMYPVWDVRAADARGGGDVGTWRRGQSLRPRVCMDFAESATIKKRVRRQSSCMRATVYLRVKVWHKYAFIVINGKRFSTNFYSIVT